MNWNNSTNIIGKSFLEFDILSSTNHYAISEIKANDLEEGTVIFAHGQSEGRGQMGTVWESNYGENILLSIVLKPIDVLPLKQFILNKIIALAVFDFIKKELPNQKVSIKWPNDIYVNQQKIAGILIQNILVGPIISASVVGIGINVNQIKFSENLNATSMKMVSNQDFDIINILPNLFNCVENWYLKLQNRDNFIIDHHYLSHLYLKGVLSKYKRQNGDTFDGVILGIDEMGKLKVEVDGVVELFDLKEIGFWK